MPTYQDCILYTNEAPKNVIRLVECGRFLHAYNRSAWLFCKLVKEFKVIRRYVKALQEDAFSVGFPTENLTKTITQFECQKTEKGFDVIIPEDKIPNEEEYETWVETVEVLPKSKEHLALIPLTGAAAEQEVLRLLRAFPLEQKTPIESMQFVAELRKLLLSWKMRRVILNEVRGTEC